MKYLEYCKGCSASVRLLSEDITKMVEEVIENGNFKIVPEETYNFRLNKCLECQCLLYGTTCSECGCIVQVRALMINKNCPHPGNGRW